LTVTHALPQNAQQEVRGRGGSGTLATGFDGTDHVSDLAAVHAAKPVFLAFSKGVLV